MQEVERERDDALAQVRELQRENEYVWRMLEHDGVVRDDA